MRQITATAVGLILAAGIVAANAQIGYGPGVNPSNPQDLTNRSNPQDLTAPGGSNPQDLVRRPPGVTPLVGPNVQPVPTSRSYNPELRYTAQAKPKAKPRQKRRHRRSVQR